LTANTQGGLASTTCTLNDSTGVIALREDPTPELDRVPDTCSARIAQALFTCNPRTNDEHASGLKKRSKDRSLVSLDSSYRDHVGACDFF
jgi:hypothetical protein